MTLVFFLLCIYITSSCVIAIIIVITNYILVAFCACADVRTTHTTTEPTRGWNGKATQTQYKCMGVVWNRAVYINVYMIALK